MDRSSTMGSRDEPTIFDHPELRRLIEQHQAELVPPLLRQGVLVGLWVLVALLSGGGVVLWLIVR
jgi:hypothetical protein